MNIPEQCKPLKKSYDDCFNENMSNMYSSLFGGKKQQQAGQTVNADPNLCEKVFEVYRDCYLRLLYFGSYFFLFFSSLVLLLIFHAVKQFKSIILYCLSVATMNRVVFENGTCMLFKHSHMIVISLTLTTTD